MAWPKGKTKEKTGGRQKGTPNKNKTDLMAKLESLGIDLIQETFDAIAKQSDEKRAESLLKVWEYVYPKRKVIEANVDMSADLITDSQVTVYLESLTQKQKMETEWIK